MIKAAVFDLGKVLLDFDYAIAARALAARGHMVADEIWRFMLRTPLLLRYETGEVTTDKFFQEICAATGYRGTAEEFAECFGGIFSPIQPMVDLHTALRARGLPTFIFSNTNELAVRHIRRNFPFFHHFEGYILSYEHGALKPDHPLYEVVERQTGRRGAELLYIDDRPENIATADQRGWRVILQENPEKTLAQVRQLGLLNGA